MKQYQVLRKVLLMIMLSIVGSYCMGVEQAQPVYTVQNCVQSITSFMDAAWRYAVQYVQSFFDYIPVDIKIQNLEEDLREDMQDCTDDLQDCQYNQEFFLRGWNIGRDSLNEFQ